jgi:F-type H+-transporting ATPase subunit b
MVFLGIADLGINLPVLLGQTLSFAFLIIILRLLVYKPVIKMLDERRERIREGLEAAERSRARETEGNAEVQAQIDAARREAQGIVAQAQQVAARIQDDARVRAQAETEATLERARSEIQLERDGAIAQLRREFGDLTIAAAEQVIGQSLDKAAHQRLIDQVLTDSSLREN